MKGLTLERLAKISDYSSAERAFLSIVLTFTGCFVARQYRPPGYMTNHLYRKLDTFGHAHILKLGSNTYFYDLDGAYTDCSNYLRLLALLSLDLILETRDRFSYDPVRICHPEGFPHGQDNAGRPMRSYIDTAPYGYSKFSAWLKRQDLTEPTTILYSTRKERDIKLSAEPTFDRICPPLVPPDPRVPGSKFRAQPASFSAFLLGGSFAWLGSGSTPSKSRNKGANSVHEIKPNSLKTQPVDETDGRTGPPTHILSGFSLQETQ